MPRSTGRYSQKAPSLTHRSQVVLSDDSALRHWDNVRKGGLEEKDLLTLSLRERQFVQAIGVLLRSLTVEDDLESEEFILDLGDDVC